MASQHLIAFEFIRTRMVPIAASPVNIKRNEFGKFFDQGFPFAVRITIGNEPGDSAVFAACYTHISKRDI
jgi:hypothetical protein